MGEPRPQFWTLVGVMSLGAQHLSSFNVDSPTHKSAMTTPWDHVGLQHLQSGEDGSRSLHLNCQHSQNCQAIVTSQLTCRLHPKDWHGSRLPGQHQTASHLPVLDLHQTFPPP